MTFLTAGYDECLYGVYDDPTYPTCAPLIGSSPSNGNGLRSLSLSLSLSLMSFIDFILNFLSFLPSFSISFSFHTKITEAGCMAMGGCNWNAHTDDPALCEEFPPFCGLCSPTSPTCHVISDVSSPQQCNTTNVCVLPNGSYLRRDAQLNCTTLGSCSVFCPNADPTDLQCLSESPRTSSACYEFDLTQEECDNSSISGVWINGSTTVCLYPEINNEVECALNQKNFSSCVTLNRTDCSECNPMMMMYGNESRCPHPYDVLTSAGVLKCLPLPYHECSMEECVTPRGDCGDDVFWNRMGYGDGSCLLPFQVNGTYSYSRRYCPYGTAFAKIGCVDYSIESKESCQSVGTWMTPAVTQEKCSAYPHRCLSPDSYLTGVTDQTTREICESLCHSVYIPMFEWTPAYWIPAYAGVTTWNTAKFGNVTEYTTTLNFTSLAATVVGAYDAATLLSMRELAICTTSYALVESLDVTTCSCAPMTFEGEWLNLTMEGNPSESEGSLTGVDCTLVDDYVVTYSLYHLCPGRRSYILSSYLSALCSIDGCITGHTCYVLVTNSSSADLVAQYRSPSVSLSFVEIQENTNKYAVVRNGKGVIVGQLIGDSALLNVTTLTSSDGSENSTVNLLTVCLTVRYDIITSSLDPSFTVYDFGIMIGSDIYPMNLTDISVRDPGISEQICVTRFTLNISLVVLYPIMRIPDYESVTSDRFDQAELGIIFTTCALYLLAIVIAVFLFSQPVTIQGGFIVNFAVFVQTLALYVIRCVYFFLLGYYIIPTVNSENLLDYILIELPTFLYIGAFSLIALSFLFLYLRAKKNMELSQWNFWAVYFVWDLLIWILFAVVVSLIATLSSTPPPVKSCEGRISSTPAPNDTARTIRIVYKSVIALIAFMVVTVTFIIGRALAEGREDSIISFSPYVSIDFLKSLFCLFFFHLSLLTYLLGPSSGTIFQTQMITLGLFLNCVAFAIYYGIDSPTPYFAIVLWFTEIVPTLLLLAMLSPRRYGSRGRDEME